MYMCVHGKCRYAKGLRHNDTGSLVPDAGQALKCLHVGGHFTTVFFKQHFTQALNGFGFLW
jgi:hypothetical protein